jgi:hypothetical protein
MIIVNNNDYLQFAIDWHNGQDSMLYAIASTGNLTIGTSTIWDNEENREATPEEQLSVLYFNLTIELQVILKTLQFNSEDYTTCNNFLIEAQINEKRLDDYILGFTESVDTSPIN